MLSLFIAITMALLLLSWGEAMPRDTENETTTAPNAPVTRVRLPRLALRLPKFWGRKSSAEVVQEIDPVEPFADAVRALSPAEAASVARNDEIMARVEALLDGPEPGSTPAPIDACEPASLANAPAPPDLPRITDFAPGDMIAIEVVGPAPRRDEISFQPCAEGALVLIEGLAELVIEGVGPEALSPEILQFRDHAAA